MAVRAIVIATCAVSTVLKNGMCPIAEKPGPEKPEADGDSGPPLGASSHSQSLSRIFEDHNRSLHSFLLTRTGNEQEAREVAQEAYVRLLQLHLPGAVSFLRAYLFKTAANIAVDRARQRAARSRIDRRDAGADLVDTLSPDRALGARQDLELLERALHELPPRYRQAFVLHRFEEWSTEAIARELGIEKRMVRNYISRSVLYCKLRIQGLKARDAKAQVMR